MSKYFICAACLALILAGCGKSMQEKAMEKSIEDATGSDADVDISNEQLKITGKTDEGAFALSSGEGTEIPDDFPADVLVYKPSIVSASMTLPEGLSVTLSTDDDSKKVLQAYKSKMASNGWSEKASMKMGTQSMLVYEKEGRNANINISPAEDETYIQIVIAKE
jgi:hypothetical protein